MSLSKKLKKLLFDHEITPTDLAKALDIPVPTIHRIVTGRTTKPHEKSIKSICNFFGISVSELIDANPNNLEYSNADNLKQVPLLDWQQLRMINNTKSNTKIAVANVSSKAFTLIMPDHSMEPVIEKGSLLIFDPEVEVTDRSYVLVKLSEPDTYVLRQILIDIDNSFIKSFNNDIGAKSLRVLSNHDKIIAKLVEIRKYL